MPRISSFVPWEEGTQPEAPCCWCGNPTDIRADTPFRPDLGALPLHLICGADLIATYQAFKAGRWLTDQQQAGMQRLAALPRLESKETPMPNPDPHPTPAENTSPVSRIVEGRPGNVEGDIDQRMANLLKDHQEMGARPAQEPTSTDTPSSLPRSMTSGAKPVKSTRKKSTKA